MKTIIYGSTDTGKRIYEDVKYTTDVIYFVDDNPAAWGGKSTEKKLETLKK